jgi:hypothetical protein
MPRHLLTVFQFTEVQARFGFTPPVAKPTDGIIEMWGVIEECRKDATGQLNSLQTLQ